MISRRHFNAFAFACGLLGGASGCAEREIATPEIAVAAPSVPAPTAAADQAENAGVDAEAPVELTPTANVAGQPVAPPTAESVEAPPAPYSPPFPDRVDLFVAPKRQGGGQSHESAERAVELMGFVRVDVPRAVLSINGQVSSLAEGESTDGIEVISVKPPSVLLQRGRQRWQATIE